MISWLPLVYQCPFWVLLEGHREAPQRLLRWILIQKTSEPSGDNFSLEKCCVAAASALCFQRILAQARRAMLWIGEFHEMRILLLEVLSVLWELERTRKQYKTRSFYIDCTSNTVLQEWVKWWQGSSWGSSLHSHDRSSSNSPRIL